MKKFFAALVIVTALAGTASAGTRIWAGSMPPADTNSSPDATRTWAG